MTTAATHIAEPYGEGKVLIRDVELFAGYDPEIDDSREDADEMRKWDDEKVREVVDRTKFYMARGAYPKLVKLHQREGQDTPDESFGDIVEIRYEGRSGVPMIVGDIVVSEQTFKRDIASGAFPRRSAEIWPDGYLSEVALLGRETPARPLPDMRFSRNATTGAAPMVFVRNVEPATFAFDESKIKRAKDGKFATKEEREAAAASEEKVADTPGGNDETRTAKVIRGDGREVDVFVPDRDADDEAKRIEDAMDSEAVIEAANYVTDGMLGLDEAAETIAEEFQISFDVAREIVAERVGAEDAAAESPAPLSAAATEALDASYGSIDALIADHIKTGIPYDEIIGDMASDFQLTSDDEDAILAAVEAVVYAEDEPAEPADQSSNVSQKPTRSFKEQLDAEDAAAIDALDLAEEIVEGRMEIGDAAEELAAMHGLSFADAETIIERAFDKLEAEINRNSGPVDENGNDDLTTYDSLDDYEQESVRKIAVEILERIVDGVLREEDAVSILAGDTGLPIDEADYIYSYIKDLMGDDIAEANRMRGNENSSLNDPQSHAMKRVADAIADSLASGDMDDSDALKAMRESFPNASNDVILGALNDARQRSPRGFSRRGRKQTFAATYPGAGNTTTPAYGDEDMNPVDDDREIMSRLEELEETYGRSRFAKACRGRYERDEDEEAETFGLAEADEEKLGYKRSRKGRAAVKSARSTDARRREFARRLAAMKAAPQRDAALKRMNARLAALESRNNALRAELDRAEFSRAIDQMEAEGFRFNGQRETILDDIVGSRDPEGRMDFYRSVLPQAPIGQRIPTTGVRINQTAGAMSEDKIQFAREKAKAKAIASRGTDNPITYSEAFDEIVASMSKEA